MASTEWEDVLHQKGIITKDQIEEIVDQVLQEQQDKTLADLNLNELEDIDSDDLDDERELEAYKRKRMAELMKMREKEKYGSVNEISKSDYPVEVTECSKSTWVIVLLYQAYIPESNLLEAILKRLAAKNKATKFLKIKADGCIENYPDRNVPTLIVYGEGDLKQNIIGTGRFGGKGMSLENVEIALTQIGAINPKKKSNDDDTDDEDQSKFRLNYQSKQQDSDSDWD